MDWLSIIKPPEEGEPVDDEKKLGQWRYLRDLMQAFLREQGVEKNTHANYQLLKDFIAFLEAQPEPSGLNFDIPTFHSSL